MVAVTGSKTQETHGHFLFYSSNVTRIRTLFFPFSSPQAGLVIYLKFRPLSEIGGDPENVDASKRRAVDVTDCPSSTDLSGDQQSKCFRAGGGDFLDELDPAKLGEPMAPARLPTAPSFNFLISSCNIKINQSMEFCFFANVTAM